MSAPRARATNASLTGFGTIQGELNNDGTITCSTGGNLSVTGDVVNNGTIRITGGKSLVATGVFVNNGLLDIITSGGTVPTNLINGPTGVVLDSSAVKLRSFSMTPTVTTIKILSYLGHNYELQIAATPGAWSTVDTKAGNDQELTFTYNIPPNNTKQFYRIRVAP